MSKNNENYNEECEWISGGAVLEKSFCEYYKSNRPMVYVGGSFFDENGKVDIKSLEQDITLILANNGIQKNLSQKVSSLINTMKRCYYEDEDYFGFEKDSICVAGGIVLGDGKFARIKTLCTYRFDIFYDIETPKPELWLKFVNELLDEKDVLTLQEFMGYCLVNSSKAQAMLFIIGNGGEGKSRIGTIMNDIFGKSAYFGSIKELAEDKFLKANLVGKKVVIDDDMNISAIKDTSFLKTLATLETPITVQQKGVQGFETKLCCKTMVFSNSAPKALYDKTEGWLRRLIILTTKPKPFNRVDDPFLSEKLQQERDSIFMWMIEGLNRLRKNNYKFTLSDKTKSNIRAMQEENCNISAFIGDGQVIKFGEGFECSSAQLYDTYQDWCSENGEIPMKIQSFTSWITQNTEKFGVVYSKKILSPAGKYIRGYKGMKIIG